MDKQDIFKYGLETEQFPLILFKYTTIKNLKKGLEKPSIYFSAAADFNDPFELKYKLDSNYTKEDWIAYYQRLGATYEEAKEIAEVIMSDPQKAHKTVSDAIEKQMNNTGILCLTPHNDNLLMWAHYADSHRGVCIEYDLKASIDAFCFPKKVEYSDEYMKFNFIKEPERITDCIFHKSSAWSYENEYRIINPDYAGEKVPIKPQAIKSIIFGCKCPQEEIDVIMAIITRKSWTHIQLKKAKIDNSEFKLKFHNISLKDNN